MDLSSLSLDDDENPPQQPIENVYLSFDSQFSIPEEAELINLRHEKNSSQDDIKRLEHIVQSKEKIQMDNAYLIPLKYVKYSILLTLAVGDVMKQKSLKPSDYLVELTQSKHLIPLSVLDSIFRDYLPLFQGEPLPDVQEHAEVSPLSHCQRSREFMNKIAAEKGIVGLQQMSQSSIYLGIDWLTRCLAEKVAMLFKDLTPEEIHQLLLNEKKSSLLKK